MYISSSIPLDIGLKKSPANNKKNSGHLLPLRIWHHATEGCTRAMRHVVEQIPASEERHPSARANQPPHRDADTGIEA